MLFQTSEKLYFNGKHVSVLDLDLDLNQNHVLLGPTPTNNFLVVCTHTQVFNLSHRFISIWQRDNTWAMSMWTLAHSIRFDVNIVYLCVPLHIFDFITSSHWLHVHQIERTALLLQVYRISNWISVIFHLQCFTCRLLSLLWMRIALPLFHI